MLRGVAQLVERLEIALYGVVVGGLVALPARLAIHEAKVEVVQVVVHGAVMVPLRQIQLDDVDDDLEGHDDDLEIEVEDEVALLDTVLFRHDGLLVEDPEEGDEEDRVEEGDIVVRVALELAKDGLDRGLDEPVFDLALLLGVV